MLLSGSLLAATVTDARGVQVRFSADPTRILTLAPHLTEWLYALEKQEALVATVAYSDFPAAAQNIPKVGDGITLDYEAIIRLQPDLILAWHTGTPTKAIEKLEALGLTVYASHVGRLNEFSAEITRVAQLLGAQEKLPQQLQPFENRVSMLRRQYQDLPKIEVFYLTWPNPLMTVNGNHIINDVIELCGGRNIFAELASLTPIIDLEALVTRSPQLILSTQMNMSGDDFFKYVHWPALTGLKRPAYAYVQADNLSRTGFRLLQGIEATCEKIHEVRIRAN